MTWIIAKAVGWMAMPFAAWWTARAAFRAPDRWKWTVRFLAASLVLGAVGVAQLADAPVVSMWQSPEGVILTLPGFGFDNVARAGVTLVICCLHALAAVWLVLRPGWAVALHFWLWHIFLALALLRPALADALVPRRYVDYPPYMTMITRIGQAGAGAAAVSALILLVLLAIALHRRVLRRELPPDAL